VSIPRHYRDDELVPAQPLRDLARLLSRSFGPRGWWPARTPFEVMVGAVLTQNTNWKGVEKAIANIRDDGSLTLGAILKMRPSALAALIRPAGYYRVKAKRLLSLCRWIDERCGGRLKRLRSMKLSALREDLLGVHGVGRETADSILLYALERPVFVIDAYTRRVLSRHGLIRGDEPYDLLRESCERAVTGEGRVRRFNELHAQIVELAKTHCRVRPVCAGCPLENWLDVTDRVANSRS
jgi:endonuclease-3 related protein